MRKYSAAPSPVTSNVKVVRLAWELNRRLPDTE